MAGNLLQVGSSGKLQISGDGKIIVAGVGDPCCCGPACMIQFTATWDCANCVWVITHGATICRLRTGTGSWVKEAVPGCVFTRWVATTTTTCAVDADCADAPVPPDPDPPTLVDADPDHSPCAQMPAECLPFLPSCAGCPTTITATVAGVPPQAGDVNCIINPIAGPNDTYTSMVVTGCTCTGPHDNGFDANAEIAQMVDDVCGMTYWEFNVPDNCATPAGHKFFLNYQQTDCIPLTGWVDAPMGYKDQRNLGGTLTLSTP